MKNRVYFISDVHIGFKENKEEPLKQDRLIEFLRSIRNDAEALYIVGDLFDFWFEYRSVVPKAGGKVLFELYNLVNSGVRVVCIPGNHDLWLGAFISDEVGISIASNRCRVTHQGLQITLDHGDDLLGGNRYHLIKRILRNPYCISLFRLLHPDLGILIAKFISSRPIVPVSGDHLMKIYQCEARRLFCREADIVIFGHLHQPVIRRGKKGTLVVLGDWVQHFSYAVMAKGQIQIKRWPSSD